MLQHVIDVERRLQFCYVNEMTINFYTPYVVVISSLTLYGHIKTAEQYSNTVIGTLAVVGWAVTFGTAGRGLGGAPGWDVTFGTARRGLGGLGPRPVPSPLYQM